MSSRYTTLGRLNASRKRVCRRAAGVIVMLSLLWAGGPARVHAAIQEVSLRGALENHDHTEAATPSSEGPPAVTNESSMYSDRLEQQDVTATVPRNIVCDTADTKYVAIRSQADSFNLRCNGEFSVLDIPNVGEVFGPDCKSPKALENGSMKAVLDHNVDDGGALRTMSVSSFPPEDEQLCLVCAVEDDAVAAGAASEIPDGDKCSVVFTILGTNNKDHVPMFAVKPQEQKVSEQAPNSPEETLGGPQGGEEEGQKQQSMPSAKILQARSSEETPRRIQRRGGSATQRAAPRHPQQLEGRDETTPQGGDDVAAEQEDPSQSSAEEQDAKQSSKQDEQQQEDGTQTQGQQGSTEEQDDQEMRTYDENEDDKTGEDSDSAEKEAKNPSKPPLQCIDKELHLRVGPGESVSFKCGDYQQVTPEATDLVYEGSKGKCGDTPAYISELVPAAEVTKVDDAIVVAVALGKSEEKTVCYRCVKQQQEQEKTNTTSPEEKKTAAAADQSAECEVFITLMPASATEDVHLASSTSSTHSFPSSFLLGTVVFLGSLLHLLQ